MKKLGKIEFIDWIILLLTIAFALLFIKSSSFPVITDVLNSHLLLRFSIGNDTINNFSTGWIVSAIFYLLNVFIPKRTKLKQYKELINKDLEYIENAYRKISKCIFDCDNIEVTILKNDPEALKKVAYYEEYKYNADELGTICELRYKYLISKCRTIVKHSNNILKYDFEEKYKLIRCFDKISINEFRRKIEIIDTNDIDYSIDLIEIIKVIFNLYKDMKSLNVL